MSKDVLEMILDYMNDKLLTLDHGKSYKTKDILCDIWSDFDKGEHIRIGIFVSSMVKQKRLPLREGKKVNGNTKTYRLA